jgi:hypothetical protein
MSVRSGGYLLLALLCGLVGARGASAGDEIVGAGILFHQEARKLGCDIFMGERRVTGCFEGFLPFEELAGEGPFKEITVMACRSANKRNKQSKATGQEALVHPGSQAQPTPTPIPGAAGPTGTQGQAKKTVEDRPKMEHGPCGDPLKIRLQGFELVEVKVTGGNEPGSKPGLSLLRQRDIRP